MPKRSFLSISQQATAQLREEIFEGRWSQTMPGRQKLAEELGLNEKTIEVALDQLEKEGLLEKQGAGKRRRIVSNIELKNARNLLFIQHGEYPEGSA